MYSSYNIYLFTWAMNARVQWNLSDKISSYSGNVLQINYMNELEEVIFTTFSELSGVVIVRYQVDLVISRVDSCLQDSIFVSHKIISAINHNVRKKKLPWSNTLYFPRQYLLKILVFLFDTFLLIFFVTVI